jgi:hypothetical protein
VLFYPVCYLCAPDPCSTALSIAPVEPEALTARKAETTTSKEPVERSAVRLKLLTLLLIFFVGVMILLPWC